jgi:membrane protein DedA with SNARE-associated domain
MYSMLNHAHSGLRWLVLVFLILAIVNAARKWNGKTPFGSSDKRLNLLALIFTHVQLLIGLGLYFISPKVSFTAETMGDRMLRFYSVEHISMMIIAIILITIGYSRAKRHQTDIKKFRATFWFYLIGLIVILLAIPWPFQELGAGWF